MSKRSVNRFAVVVAAAMLLAGASGCGMLEKPAVSIAGMKLQDIGVSDATMLFDVKVDNPYAVPLPLSNIDYALASQGQQFLKGAADVQGTVPAMSSKTLPFPIKINYLQLFNAVKGARPGAVIPYTADMGLSVKPPMADALRVPMSKEGELSIPTGPGLMDKLKDLTK